MMFATTFFAAVGWIFSKEAIQGLPPFGFIGLRFLFASLCLLPFCWQDLRSIKSGDIARSMAVGCLLGTALLTWIYSVSISDSLGEGAFIMSLSMLFVPIVAWGLFKERPQRIFWFALPIAIIGLILLSFGSGTRWLPSVSQLWFLAAAIILAIHFNFNSKYARKLRPLLLTCLQLFVTGCMGLLASLLFETWPDEVANSIWGWFAMSVFVATSLRYVLQTTGQKYITAANAAIIMILEPIWIVLLSMAWYGEAMPAYKILGCILILSASFIYRSHDLFVKFSNKSFHH